MLKDPHGGPTGLEDEPKGLGDGKEVCQVRLDQVRLATHRKDQINAEIKISAVFNQFSL